ncbi:MAG: TetR/AcrR family transcriptional regulator [Pseudomonadota bacterium]
MPGSKNTNTAQTDESRTIKRGRPRSQAARRAILKSAYSILLEDGMSRVTVEAVAARAKVGKPTIYRYWKNARELVLASILEHSSPQMPQALSLSALTDLKTHLQRVIAVFATAQGRQIAQLMAASEADSELSKAFRNEIILRSREEGRSLIDRAVENGELGSDVNIETMLDMVYGAIFYRLLIGHQQLDTDLADQIVELVSTGNAN